MTCLGVLDRGERDKNNETGLKEGGGIEMSTTVLSIYAMHVLFALKYLPANLARSRKYFADVCMRLNICVSTLSISPEHSSCTSTPKLLPSSMRGTNN